MNVRLMRLREAQYSSRVRPILSFLLFFAMCGSGTDAVAHARLVKSIPPANALLSKAPRRIALWFNEPPEIAFSTIEVRDEQGHRLTTGPVHARDSKALEMSLLITLPAGRYRVKYRVLSVDGHVLDASFKFELCQPEAP